MSAGAGPGNGPWGLYVHVPFCPYKCDYCDFVAVATGERGHHWLAAYPDLLRAEAAFWRRRLDPGPPMTAFYGGGTPTMLPAAELAHLHRDLAACLGVPDAAEVTVECNPGTINADGLRVLRRAGVNRLSLGLQTARDALLAAHGRRHTWRQFQEAFAAARAAGFTNLAVDLMCGLPGQTLEDVTSTLAAVLALGPTHISLYALQVEAGTVLARRVARQPALLPPEELVVDQLARARAVLVAAGFEHYEISNFARPGYRCRHNLLYWRNRDYLGLGIGAHTHWRGRRWANTPKLALWRDGLGRADESWVVGRQTPDAARERGDAAFLELRLLDGIDLAAFSARFGLALGEAFPGVPEGLVADGLCALEDGHLRLRPSALAVANRAFMAFV